MPLVYYITDYAYEKLIDLAKQLNYIEPNAKRAKGMSEFLDALSHQEFIDTRPPEMIEEHEKASLRSSPPRWTITGEYRKPRLLSLTPTSIFNYLKIGILTGVIVTEKLVNPGRINRSEEALVASVLEAIGLELLTPTSLPPVKKVMYTNGAVSRVPTSKRTRESSTEIPKETSLDIYFRRGSSRIAGSS